MAMLSSNSPFHPDYIGSSLSSKQLSPKSQLYSVVKAAVLDQARRRPSSVPADLVVEIRAALAASADQYPGVIGGDAHDAGWRMDRFPATRDPVGSGHPIFDALVTTIRCWQPEASSATIAGLLLPANRQNLLQACIYRFSPVIGPAADLNQIYRDSAGRTVFDSGYCSEAYDADHCTGEIMQQVLDVTFLQFVNTLDWLRVHSNQLFDAVWHRNAKEVNHLIDNQPLPPMSFLRQHEDAKSKLIMLVSLFWEMERLFELLRAFGGRQRVTKSRLQRILSSTTALNAAVASGDRTAQYVATSWCHRLAIALLIQDGALNGHDSRHPHIAFGPAGMAENVDELATINTAAAIAVASSTVQAAVPFQIDARLRKAGSELLGHYHAGRDIRTLAVLFLLEARQELGENKGGRYNPGGRYFEFETDGAIGRLAMIFTSRICPETADAVLKDIWAVYKKGRAHLAPLVHADLVANPVAWQRLYPGLKTPSAPAARAVALNGMVARNGLLDSLVAKVRKDDSRFIFNDVSRLGNSICFSISMWFAPYREVEALLIQWRNRSPGLREAFPPCFSKISAWRLAFCGQIAAGLFPAANPFLQDPFSRKSNAYRGVANAGRPKKKKKKNRIVGTSRSRTPRRAPGKAAASRSTVASAIGAAPDKLRPHRSR
ncbi:MAG: hypothetical protein QHC67_10215 [Sphingobium sp.]|uniref:hypothetical protein n=1 Tax=Sphingobium sp. TaxID=1912891 RepID=UPI0029ADA16F|nr:hypothetical protein [Sphingobium sp.]MDX3910179.1 hypothetical protein [Sphingobium sp.]